MSSPDATITDPRSKRRFRTPEEALTVFNSLRTNDPQKGKREQILAAYYQHPHTITREEMENCMVTDPPRSNYGQFCYMIDKEKASFSDSIYERESKLVAKYVGPRKPPQGLTDEMVGDVITRAWNKYFMPIWGRRGRAYYDDKELQITDMCLFGKGISAFAPGDVFPKFLEMNKVWPDPHATFRSEDWEYCFVEEEYPATILWEMANDPDDNWNREEILRLLKRDHDNTRNISDEDWVKAFEDGTFRRAYDATIKVIRLYVKEWNEDRMRTVVMSYDATQRGWLWEQSPDHEHAPEDMSQVVSVLSESLGHGRYYYTPSRGERLFFICKEYDMLMNAINAAARFNSMALFERQPDQSRAPKVFKHMMVYEPGTIPDQKRFELPIRDMVVFVDKMMKDMRGARAEFDANDMGQAETATRVQAALSENQRVRGLAVRRFHLQHGFELFETYRRSTTLLENVKELEGTPEGKAFKRFKKELKDNGLDNPDYYGPDNVQISSAIVAGAGDPMARLQLALEAIRVSNISPSDEIQRKQKANALSALVGVDNLPDMRETETRETAEAARVGLENAVMTAGGTGMTVLPSDDDSFHLMGDAKQDQQGGMIGTPGHIDTIMQQVRLAMEMFQRVDQENLPHADQVVFADKVSEVLETISIGIEHSGAHFAKLARDSQKKPAFDQARQMLAEAQRQRDGLIANFTQMREAITARAQEQQGGGGEEMAIKQMELQKAMLELQGKQQDIENKRMQSDLKIQSLIEEHQAKIEAKRLDSEVKREIMENEAASKLAADLVKKSPSSQ